MLGSYRLLIILKLILFELLGLKCIEESSFRRYRRSRSSITNNYDISASPVIVYVTVSINDYFAVINCSTPERVPHHKLDWYFQTRTSSKPPRVIWQRGRSDNNRYIAYSPDQFRHFLQIKPIHYNDSGTYMCLDQTTGFDAKTDLVVGDSPSCAKSMTNLRLTTVIYLIILSLVLPRVIISERQLK